MEKYNPLQLEPKWRKTWEEKGMYKAVDFDKRQKKYFLFEFPYSSGDRLHVGHARSYIALDTMARKSRMEGNNVLLPMGWDAFGLPAENYAIKNKVSPQKITLENIANAREQAKSWGLSIDWDREINTTDPDYYKWTQWIFVQLFKKDMAYRAKTQVNWCPSCKTNLANEEVLADGTHERCGHATEQRDQEQWLIRITKYADRLIEDLKDVDFLQRISTQQVNWIGRSEGTSIKFKIKLGFKGGSTSQAEVEPPIIEVFTTRADTLYGCTYLVLAPECSYVNDLLPYVAKEKIVEIKKYIEDNKKKSSIDRTKEEGVKTGVKLEGVTAINPINSKEIEVWIADYVIADYGTGAVMAVPAHDTRDWDFAKKHGLPVICVIEPPEALVAVLGDSLEDAHRKTLEKKKRVLDGEEPYENEGVLINSEKFNELASAEAKKRITGQLKKDSMGDFVVNYKLRDWIFSRQHYWGEPIPIVYCEKCGYVAVPEDQLPVKLPELERYEPSGTGESPLAKITEWVNTTCPQCGGKALRETDTMPNWAGSNWYYLAYLLGDQKLKSGTFGNDESKKIFQYWMPVDLYNGGMEHTTLHLLYSRFIYKFLYDIGVVPTKEPYKARRSHGMILGADRQKMSKSRGNVINPDDVIVKYGADTFRVYEAFIGPFDQMIHWSDESLAGCSRFLSRVWTLVSEKVGGETPAELKKKLHKTIKKVSSDIDEMKFNTAVAIMMEFINSWQNEGELSRDDAGDFLKILCPFAPHITEELWGILGNKGSIHLSSWPKYDEALLKEDVVNIVVQENGKFRGNIEAPIDSSEEEVIKICNDSSKFVSICNNPKKVIYVKNRLINFVK